MAQPLQTITAILPRSKWSSLFLMPFALGLFDQWHLFSSSCFGHQIFLIFGIVVRTKEAQHQDEHHQCWVCSSNCAFHPTNMSEHHTFCIFHTRHDRLVTPNPCSLHPHIPTARMGPLCGRTLRFRTDHSPKHGDPPNRNHAVFAALKRRRGGCKCCARRARCCRAALGDHAVRRLDCVSCPFVLYPCRDLCVMLYDFSTDSVQLGT